MIQQNSSISGFRVFILSVVLPYILILTVTGMVFNYFFEQKIILSSEITGAYKVNRIANYTDKDEIPFLGSSRAEGTFIPDSLVNHGFNYGISGTQDDVMLYFLQEECKKHKTTPVIMNLDLDGLSYGLGDKSNYIYNSSYVPVRKLLDKQYKTIYNVPFLKYYGYFEIYFKYFLSNKHNFTKFINHGAYIDKDEITSYEFNNGIQRRIREKWWFHNDKKLLSGYMELIQKKSHRKFIFIITPYHNSCFKSLQNFHEVETFLSALRNIPNVVVLNFSKINYPDDYFIDITHLNLKGALAFNALLKDSLKTYLR